MRASKPAAENFKNVCEDFPNIGILTKSSTPGEIQLTFGYAAVGNKSLGESVVAFSLTGDLSSPSVISFNIKIAFAADGEKIRLPAKQDSAETAAAKTLDTIADDCEDALAFLLSLFCSGLRDYIACLLLGGIIPSQNSGYTVTRLWP